MQDISVDSAEHIEGHVLEIKYSDGHRSRVDFAPFIFSNNHPDYEQYKHPAKFADFRIIDGNLNWDDYTMIFSIDWLIENEIER